MKFNAIKSMLLAIFFCFGLTINAQESCSQYYSTKVGVKYELTKFDKKKRKIGLTKNEVISYTGNKATIHTVSTDLKKNKETLNADLHVICGNNEVTVDMNEVFQEQMKKQMEGKDASIDISGVDPVYPNNLKKGQQLPDVKTDMAISSRKTNFNFYATNRKVIGAETVTTPACTFD